MQFSSSKIVMLFRSWQDTGSMSMTGGGLKQISTLSLTTSCMSTASTCTLYTSALKTLMPFRSSFHMAGLALFWRHSISSTSSPLHVSILLLVRVVCIYCLLSWTATHACHSCMKGQLCQLYCAFVMFNAKCSACSDTF